MAIKFSDRVFGANVEKKIIDIFDNLQKGSFDQKPLSETAPTHQDYLGDRTPFARMWSANLISGSKRQEIVYNIVNDNRDESYVEINEPIGDVINKELTDNPYLKPKAGITSITSKTEGSLGAIKSTDVSFVVHNKRDFEDIFLPFFLKPGSTVVVDYGWSDKSFNPYDVSKTISNTDLELSAFKDDTYGGVDKKPNGYINDNIGLVDTLIGKVTNYNASVNQQGSFECSITLVSENTSLLDSEITEENNLKFIFANKIEEIIIKTLTSGATENIGNNELEFYDRLSADDKQQVREKFYETIEIKATGKTTGKDGIGVIPPSAVKAGLFYQDVTDAAGLKQNDKDVLYINYGLFEDLFLNALIAENRITNSSHQVNYNTKDTFVRYESNLLARQKALLGSNEAMSLFLYPNDWRDSYNGIISIEEYRTQKQITKDDVQYKNEYKTKVIPLRELFISVALISKTFAQKQNINDALNSIFEAINEDSYGVFKLKMISLNKSYSSLSVQDVNLIPELPEKINMLKFDVTSDKSIVSGLDYKFGMPKGGLASMIAIGEKDDFAFFDESSSDNLNFLRILGPNKDKFGEDVFFKSLPIIKSKEDKPKEQQKTAYDFSQNKAKDIVSNIEINVSDNIGTNWTDTVTKLLKEKEKTVLDGNLPKPKVNETSEDKKEKSFLPSNGVRDYYGKEAKRLTVLNNKTISVSPILPVELTLTIYGNTYLQIGDIFSINFLPDFYQDNIMFQILNIEQKVSSNWETTYSTVMRLRPDRKGIVTMPNIKPVGLSKEYVKDLLQSTDTKNTFLGNALADEGTIFVEVVPENMLAWEIPVKYDDDVISKDDTDNKLHKKGDSRLLQLEFGFPKTQQDMAFLYGFQKTIGEWLANGALIGKNTIIQVKKEGLPALDTDNLALSKNDFFITAFVEDEDVAIFGKDNASILYLKQAIEFIEFKNTGGNKYTILIKLMESLAKNSKLKAFYDNFVKKAYPNKNGKINKNENHGIVEGIAVGDKTGTLWDKYGFVIPSVGFVFAKKSFVGTRSVYAINVTHIKGLTKQVPLILIPDWFFINNGGVNKFCEALDKNYNETLLELKEAFLPDPETGGNDMEDVG